jgi:hypothetical protein
MAVAIKAKDVTIYLNGELAEVVVGGDDNIKDAKAMARTTISEMLDNGTLDYDEAVEVVYSIDYATETITPVKQIKFK